MLIENTRTETINSKWTRAKPLESSTTYQLHFEKLSWDSKAPEIETDFRAFDQITYHILLCCFLYAVQNLK